MEEEAGAAAGSDDAAEDPAATETEAPEALFQLDIGDAEVDFFLEGSWRASLSGSFGLLIAPDGTQLSPFPGFGERLVFQQLPDLTFSVWLLNRFFIEASVIGDFFEQEYDYFDQNYILMGYLGEEDEFLKRILVGSKDVGIDPFPFIDVPEPGRSSLGVEAVMGTGMSEHQLLLRYDNNEPDSLTYIGGNLVSEQEITLDEYIRGRFFKLPDDDIDGGTLEVYLEDPDGTYSDGDGRNYRKATVDDAELDRANGTVYLKEAAEGWVLVYYEKNGQPVGTALPGLGVDALAGKDLTDDKINLSQPDVKFEWGMGDYLGQDMNERQVTVDSKICLRLYRPGEFSPFEILSSYALDGTVPEDLSRLRVAIVRKGNLNVKESTDVAFRLTPGEDFIQAYFRPDPELRTEFRNLYPFLDASNPTPPFDTENLLYGPLSDAKPGYLDYEILASELTPVSAYQIGSDIVPGSVQILRNGISETRFDVNYETGVITFLTEIAEDDRLVVSFRRQSALANNGDILFAWGNTLSISEALNLELATGVRWNLLPGSYTDEAYTRTGSVVASAGIKGAAGPLSYQASVAGAYTNPDTTGIMRLLGMELTGISVPLSENTAYVASPPDGDDPLQPLAAQNHSARGKLLYKDYRSYGLLGTSVLMPYTEDPPASQQYPYDQTGSKPGPYIAAGSSEGTDEGQSLVLDFDLATDEWVGIQLPVSYGGAVSDLSRIQGISLLYRTTDIDAGSSFDVYLQLGAIGEDLDEDGVLDEELSPSARGFVFDEGNYGVDLKIGSGPKNEGNDRLDSEDMNGNGFLDLDDDSTDPDIITLTAANITDTVGWTSFIHTFTAGEKRKIARTRSLRLVVVRTGGSDATGRLLLDEISLAGSRFYADWVVDPGGAPELGAREIEEWEMEDPPSKPLLATFAEVEDIFHPFEETQKVVEISWSGGSGETWQTRGYTEAQTEGIRYRSIVYYTHSPFTVTSEVLNFSLADEEGNAIQWSYPPFTTTEWEKIVVSLDEGKIYRNGTELTGAGVDVSEPANYGSLGLFTVELTNTDTGTLYLDELHLTDPEGFLGAGATLDLELNLPGELVSWGAHPLIHDLSFRQRAAYASRGFSGLYGTPLAAHRYSSMSELDLGLSLVDMSVDFTVAGTDDLVTLGGGHGITVPNVPSPVVFSDSFSLRERDTGKELNRKNTLALKFLPVVQLDLQSQAGSLERTLSQSWGADLQITPARFSLQNSLSMFGAVDEFVVGSDGYFSNWIDGYALLFPYPMLSGWDIDKWPSAKELERKADLNLEWSLNTMPVGLRTIWRHGFHSYDFVHYDLVTADRLLQSSADMELSVPLRWQDRGVSLFSITPGYRRRLDVVDPETGVGDYADDFSRSFQTIYSQQYLYGQFPFAELYSPNAEQLFLDLSDKLNKADYSAEAYLQLSRRFSSRIRDLFLPSLFEMSIKKQFVKDEDLTDLYNSYSLTAQSTALNLFGDLGAYPVFSFYRTDEFSTSLSLTMDVGEQTGSPPLRGLEMNLDHFFAFEGQKEEQLTFENRLSLRNDREEIGTELLWGDTVKFLFLWSRHPEKGVKLPFLPEKFGSGGYWSHQESLILELDGPGEDTSYHPFNLVVSHESAAKLPDYGEISTEISAGFDVEKTSAGVRYWRLGLSGGISVQIEF